MAARRQPEVLTPPACDPVYTPAWFRTDTVREGYWLQIPGSGEHNWGDVLVDSAAGAVFVCVTWS